MKKLLSVFVILAAVCLIASPAHAFIGIGSSLEPGGMAAELVGPSANTQVPAVVSWTFGPFVFPAPHIVAITLANGQWTSSSLVLCDGITTALYSNGSYYGAPVAPNTEIDLVLDGGTSADNAPGHAAIVPFTTYYLQTGSSCAVPFVPSADFLDNLVINAGSVAPATVWMNTSDQTTPGAPVYAGAAPLVTLANQFHAHIAAVDSQIDFSTNMVSFMPSSRPAPLATVPPYTTAHASNAGLLLTSNEFLFPKVLVSYPGGLPFGCGGTVLGATLDIKVKGVLDGLGTLTYNGSTAPIQNSQVGAGLVEITNANLSVCSEFFSTIPTAGQTPLVLTDDTASGFQMAGAEIFSGNVTSTITLNGTASNYSRVVLDPVTWTFPSRITQLYIPYLATDPTKVATCVLSNANYASPTAAVSLDVLTSEDIQSVVPTTDGTGGVQYGYSLGTIPANQSLLLFFNQDSVMLESTLGPAAPFITTTINVPITGGNGNGWNYSARLNVNAPPKTVTLSCLMEDPSTGTKRPVPVYQNTNMLPLQAPLLF